MMAKVAPSEAPTDGRKRKRGKATDRVGGQVAAYRKDRHLKVSELARAVGVSPSLISQIERGQSQPSVSTLFALAEALDVPVDAFFAESADENRAAGKPAESTAKSGDAEGGRDGDRDAGTRYVVRRDGRAVIDIEGGVHWERLTPETLRDVEFLELVYAPGAESHPELYRHPGAEMVLVLSGRLDIFVGFERYELSEGDSIHFPSSLPHRYINPGDEVARAVTVILHDGDRPGSAEPEQRRP
jgi:transcriptional regulator with XRE-family HTH domain